MLLELGLYAKNNENEQQHEHQNKLLKLWEKHSLHWS